MDEEHHVEATNDALLAGSCTWVLLESIVHATVGEGAAKRVLAGGAEGRALNGGTDFVGVVVVILGMKELPLLLLVLCCCPCNSFSTSIANWTKRLVVVILYNQEYLKFYASIHQKVDTIYPMCPLLSTKYPTLLKLCIIFLDRHITLL